MNKIVFWTLLVIVLLLVVTHPQGFASAVSSVGGFATTETGILSGGSVGGVQAPQGGRSGMLYGFNAVTV